MVNECDSHLASLLGSTVFILFRLFMTTLLLGQKQPIDGTV